MLSDMRQGGAAWRPGARRAAPRWPAPRGGASGGRQSGTIPAAAPAPAQPAADRDATLGLIQWAVAQGIIFAKVRPARFEGGLRGMGASFAIAPGEALVAVPQAAALRTHPGEHPPPGLGADLWAVLPFYARLAARIVAARAAGPGAPDAPYLAVLPASVPLPALWSPEQLAQLQYPHLQQQVERQQREWAQLFTQLQPWLAAQGCDQAGWRAALTVARSRAFAAPYAPLPLSQLGKAAAALQALVLAAAVGGGGGAGPPAAVEVAGLAALAGVAAWVQRTAREQQQYALCPLIDFINHSSDSQSECEFDLVSGQFKVVSSRAYAPGEQVFMSYGAQSNDALLQQYGFVEAGNPADRYMLTDAGAKLLAASPAAAGAPASGEAAAQQLQELVLTPAGMDAAGLAAVQQLLRAAGLPQADALALVGAACRQEAARMGGSEAGDAAILVDLQRLPACQQELAAAQEQLAKAEAALALAEARQRETEEAVAVGVGAATAPAVSVQPEPAPGPAGAIEATAAASQQSALMQQAVQQAAARVQQLGAELERLAAATAGVLPVAVEFRLAKRRVLAACMTSLGCV